MWVRGAAFYCFIAALALAALARSGRLPEHDLEQFAPVLVHLALNGLALVAMSVLVRRLPRAPAWAVMGSFLIACGMSYIGLILAGTVAFDFHLRNAPGILLALPVIILFAGLKDGPAPSPPGPEILEESPQYPVLKILGGFAKSACFQAVALGNLLLAVVAGTRWYFILRSVLCDGTRYDISSDLTQIKGLIEWPAILIFVLLFLAIGLIAAADQWAVLLRQAFDRLKARAGFVQPTEQERAIVQSHLKALWDYANPADSRGSASTILLPLLAPLAVVAACFCFIFVEPALAQRLFPRAVPAGAEWHLIVPSRGGAAVPLLSFIPAWSLYRLIVDHWPQALRATLTTDLDRNTGPDISKLDALRRELLQEVRRGSFGSPFDPEKYLARRRRRSTRWLHITALFAVLVMAFCAWRGMATYTLITASEIEDIGFFTGRHYNYRYGDVQNVRRDCRLGRDDTLSYEIILRDRRSVKLTLGENLQTLKRIDQQIRNAGATFEPIADSLRRLAYLKKCMSYFARQYRDADGIAQIMHLE